MSHLYRHRISSELSDVGRTARHQVRAVEIAETLLPRPTTVELGVMEEKIHRHGRLQVLDMDLLRLFQIDSHRLFLHSLVSQAKGPQERFLRLRLPHTSQGRRRRV